MNDTMNIEDYLAQGGVLTVPGNVPARYWGELLRLMEDAKPADAASSLSTKDDINRSNSPR